ncbi:MAG: hypothetical protein A4S09_10535 [Proteobacteria bacterium SG_bin7]|nr:MAG: hypothetical protein A4S09_10535 [Proteobacteria bacterium SG_bin7]
MIVRQLYQKSIDNFSLPPHTLILINQIDNGTDNSLAYEDFISTDEFFIETVFNEAFPMANEPIKSLAQAVSTLGRERVRNFIFAHTINRIFDSTADLNHQSYQKTTRSLRRALEAENVARNTKLEKPEIGFTCGLIFDFFEQTMISDSSLKKAFENFFESQWRHGLRTAIIATELANASRVKITSTRNLFAAGLLHDVGKLMLALGTPEGYQSVLLDCKVLQKKSPLNDSYEIDIENETLKIAHPELGSLFLWQFEPLRELEALVEYHHDFGLLPIRSADLNVIEVLVSVADRLAHFLEESDVLELTTTTEILRPHAKFFRKGPAEILDLLITLRATFSLL